MVHWLPCLAFRYLPYPALPRLRRRRLGGASRRNGRSFLGSPGTGTGSAFANGSSSRGANLGGVGGGGGGSDEEEEEQDEGQMAEDASLMFLTAIRYYVLDSYQISRS